MTKTLAVLIVRNEAAFLLEWLAHHKAVGFSDFLVLSNDCQDGTDAMLDRLDDMGVITHVRNDPIDKAGIQWGALKCADKHPLTKSADWIMALDIDEFVNIHCGDHTLSALHAVVPDATAITLTWRMFGNNGVVGFADAPIASQFTRAAPSPCYWPWRAAMFKTLFRNDGTYRKLGIHRPRKHVDAKLNDARWVDCNGRRLPNAYKTGRLFSDFWQDNTKLAQLNHYALGSMESYVLKRARGQPGHAHLTLGLEYWVDRNLNQVEDRSISALDAVAKPILEELKADQTLGDLHNKGCAWRAKRFEALMHDEACRNLFGQLLMTPPTRALTKAEAERLMRWARAGKRRPAPT